MLLTLNIDILYIRVYHFICVYSMFITEQNKQSFYLEN
jgi:hypothetical protein